MSFACGICGLPMEPNERLHPHIPDFYLKVWDCEAYLVRFREFEGGSGVEELLPFELPEHWVDFILTTCGGSISMSGCYRLPGLIWEWVLARCRGDELSARYLAERIENLIGRVK